MMGPCLFGAERSIKGVDVSCPRRFLLVRYHAGTAAALEAEAVQDHLAGCKRCRKIVEDMERQRRKFLEKHPAEKVVAELLERAGALERKEN